MDVLNGFIFPLASIFYDLYMYVVLPGMTPISIISKNGYFTYVNIFNGLSREFQLPDILDKIVDVTNVIFGGLIESTFPDITLFGFLVLSFAIMFFFICLVRVISNFLP